MASEVIFARHALAAMHEIRHHHDLTSSAPVSPCSRSVIVVIATPPARGIGVPMLTRRYGTSRRFIRSS